MSQPTTIPPFPPLPAPPTPPGEDLRPRRWMVGLLLFMLAIIVLDQLAGTGVHIIQFLLLVPVLASMLAGPVATLLFTLASMAATITSGLLHGTDIPHFHLPAAAAVAAAGGIGIWASVTRIRNARAQVERELAARQELVESLSLLQATLESTVDGILVVNRQQRVVSYNARFVEIWRIDPDLLAQRSDEKLLGAVLSQLVDPESFLARVRILYERPEEESHDTLHFRDGRIIDRFSRPQLIGSRIIGRVWNFRDVTAARLAERAADQSRQRLDRLLSSSPAVLFSIMAQYPYQATYLSANVVDQLGYEAERFLADPHFWQQIAMAEDVAARRDWPFRLLAAGRLSEVFRFRHRDGRLIWLSFELRLLLGPEGRPSEIVGSSIDVTERLESEAERNRLRESLARSQATSAIGVLVAGVAHEVRNPLFTISASLDTFEARFGSRAEYRPYLAALRNSVDRLSRLMSLLLDYGRPPKSVPIPSSLFEWVQRAIEQLPPHPAAEGISIENQVPINLTPAMLDPNQILHVFQNLLENAIQHSPPGGRVVVSGRPMIRDGQPGVECRVDDFGRGFNPDSIGRIFEPFVSERHGGTGLGLSIVQRIVEEHGGQIEATNRPEGGASVTLWFPAAPAGGEMAKGQDVPASNPAR